MLYVADGEMVVFVAGKAMIVDVGLRRRVIVAEMGVAWLVWWTLDVRRMRRWCVYGYLLSKAARIPFEWQ